MSNRNTDKYSQEQDENEALKFTWKKKTWNLIMGNCSL
jgi:hypothetical protein